MKTGSCQVPATSRSPARRPTSIAPSVEAARTRVRLSHNRARRYSSSITRSKGAPWRLFRSATAYGDSGKALKSGERSNTMSHSRSGARPADVMHSE